MSLPGLWVPEPCLVVSRCPHSSSQSDSVSVSGTFCCVCLVCAFPALWDSAAPGGTVTGSGGLGLGVGGFSSEKAIFFEALSVFQVSLLVVLSYRYRPPQPLVIIGNLSLHSPPCHPVPKASSLQFFSSCWHGLPLESELWGNKSQVSWLWPLQTNLPRGRAQRGLASFVAQSQQTLRLKKKKTKLIYQ